MNTPRDCEAGCSSVYSSADSTIDQLWVEMSSSIDSRMTTCSIASLFRPTVIIILILMDGLQRDGQARNGGKQQGADTGRGGDAAG
jgi:hypothetical protein